MKLLQRKDARSPRLSWDSSTPEGEARGVVLLTHGYGEHSGRYGEVIDAWTSRGLRVVSYDLRGHGESEGHPRGHVDSFRDYVRDAEDVLEAAHAEAPWDGRPAIFGHSLGGLISTHVVLSRQSRYAGLAMTSPFFGLAMAVNPVEKALGKVVSRVAPRLTRPAGLSGSELTHDAEIAAAYDADPLGVKHVTVGWFTEVEGAQGAALENASALDLPVFCLAAGDDRVVAVDATRRFFERLGSDGAELRVVDGLFHELLNERERATFVAELGDRMLEWVERRAPSGENREHDE